MSVRDACWFIVTTGFIWTWCATWFRLGTTVIHHVHCRGFTQSVIMDCFELVMQTTPSSNFILNRIKYRSLMPRLRNVFNKYIHCCQATDQLNSDKTEVVVLVCSLNGNIWTIIVMHWTINNPAILFGGDFWVQLRVDTSIKDKITTVVHSSNYNIRQLQMIRLSPTSSALRVTAYALALSCNALYVNAPECELRQLQLLINTAAQVVSVRSWFDHITDFIRDDLNWLPITQRVHFKVC